MIISHSEDFSCPTSFRSQLLLDRVENNVTMATCYVADPIDAEGKRFNISKYTSWRRPDNGEWDFKTDIVESKADLARVSSQFYTDEAARGLPPTVDGIDDVIGQLAAISTDSKADTTTPQEMAFLATIPHIVDAMAMHDFMPLKHANGFQRVVNSRPIGEGNTDRRILLRVQEVQRREALRTATVQPANLPALVTTAELQPVTRLMPLQPAEPVGFWQKLQNFFYNLIPSSDTLQDYASTTPKIKQAPGLLRLSDAPYTDAEDLLHHVGDDKETLIALLQSAHSKIPMGMNYKRRLWDVMQLEQEPTSDAVRVAYALLNYELNRDELEKYANGMIIDAENAFRNREWAKLNNIIDIGSEAGFYRLALLKCYWHTHQGLCPGKVCDAWMKPFQTPSIANPGNQQEPSSSIVARCFMDKLIPVVKREMEVSCTNPAIERAWQPNVPARLQEMKQKSDAPEGIAKSNWSLSFYKISDSKLIIPGKLIGNYTLAKSISNKVSPTVDRCYTYNKATWWEPTRTIASLRPDIIRSEDRVAPVKPALEYKGPPGMKNGMGGSYA